MMFFRRSFEYLSPSVDARYRYFGARRESLLTFNNSINRAALLTETAVDAFRHINVISRRSSASILTLLRLDGDGRGRADGFTKLAGNAAFLSCWVAA